MSAQDTEKLLPDAARGGDIDQARKLLDQGTDPSIKDSSRFTPLHYAAERGKLSMIELLLEYGADPNAKDSSGSTSLHTAAQDGHNKIIQLLLEYWADPNSKDDSGLTPLHIAAKGRKVSTVKLLLDAGADKEVQDHNGNTSLHIATELEIARLLLGEPMVIPQQAKDVPLFPITINGNTLDPSILNAGPIETKYILVQSWARLSLSDRQDLENANIRHLDYVAKNTYLCQYQDKDLEKIRKLEAVVYVDIYRMELKITPRLKEARPYQNYKVDVVFHEDVATDSQSLQTELKEKSHCDIKKIEFLSKKARLPIDGQYLKDVASIDDVRCMEEVGEVVAFNDFARQILEINPQPPTGSIQQRVYQGESQTIAIADTGLDRGMNVQVHHAFATRVQHWLALHNETADFNGHGTHVCGSALGNGKTANGVHVMGTAPEAGLIVQSIWNTNRVSLRSPNLIEPGLEPPSNLTTLFQDPYQKGARVHSNSWGSEDVERDAQGHIIRFCQLSYSFSTAASEIDDFVYQNPDMVICFAAGNYGQAHRLSLEHIGAQAAAKNCITVGASQSSRYGNVPDTVANFSSRGRTIEGRYKPDVVAPGTHILSAASGSAQNETPYHNDKSWCYMDGTSMATPLVAGCAAVLREALTSLYLNLTPPFPTAALIRALLVNGANIIQPVIGNFVPSNDSGFGRVNMANSFEIVHRESGTGFRECEVTDGIPWEESINVDSGYTTLKATLVWSDPPGEKIKNNLLLEVENTGRSKRALNHNNVQQIVWDKVLQGVLKFKVGIIGNLDKSPQPFAVAWRLS